MRFESTGNSRKRRPKKRSSSGRSSGASSRRVYSSMAASRTKPRKKRKIGRKILALLIVGLIGWQGFAHKDAIVRWFDFSRKNMAEKQNHATPEDADVDSIGVSETLAETIRRNRERMFDVLELPDTTVLHRAEETDEVAETASETAVAQDSTPAVAAATDTLELSFWEKIRPGRVVNNLFQVQQVRIEGVLSVSQDTVRALIGEIEGRGMFELDLESLAGGVERHSRVRKALIRRRLPGTLIVAVQERREVMLVVSDGRLYGVDSEGVILSNPNPGWPLDAPVVTGYSGALTPGGSVEDPGLMAALVWARHLARKPLVGEWVSEVHLDAGIVDHVLGAGGVRVQPGDHSVTAQVAALNAYLASTDKRASRSRKIVDMRFPGFLILKEDPAQRGNG